MDKLALLMKVTKFVTSNDINDMDDEDFEDFMAALTAEV